MISDHIDQMQSYSNCTSLIYIRNNFLNILVLTKVLENWPVEYLRYRIWDSKTIGKVHLKFYQND